MTNLVIINDNQTITTSKLVAKAFEKHHAHVIRDIENLECSKDFHKSNFGFILNISDLGLGRTRQDKAYNITRDGFTFLAMGYTGKRAAEFKEAYIRAFNEMEAKLKSANPLENKYSIEDLIIAQATSIKEMKRELLALKNAASAQAPTLPVATSTPQQNEMAEEKMYSVAEYMDGKNFTHASKAFIGYCARIFSTKNNLPFTPSKKGNRYEAKAIEFGIAEVILTKQNYLNIPVTKNAKLIADLKKDPVAQSIIKLSIDRPMHFRGSLKSKLKSLVYNKLNNNTDMQFSLTKNASWITVRRIK